jgi:hypothetical protein
MLCREALALAKFREACNATDLTGRHANGVPDTLLAVKHAPALAQVTI